MKTDNLSASSYDVLILGSGIAGTVLAVLLARHGVKVLVVERGEHPRFAIGESTVPETTFLFEVLAKRYDVPELEYFKNFGNVRKHISSSCGVKRGFSFVYHRPGQEQLGRESTQFPTWGVPFGPDLHLFRQDIDAYLVQLAIQYGAHVWQRTTLTSLETSAEGVMAKTSQGKEITAKYLIDGSGYGSPMAQQFQLREQPCSYLTNSRCIFTHMIGVQHYEDCGPSASEHRLPYAFSQGTLHHLFRGGWFWVIPFNNHDSSTNPLCSVGLNLDRDLYPDNGMAPEEEFWKFVKQFPSVAKQFANARSVRPWVGTKRIQYGASKAAGQRFFMLPHSAGFVDALFSGGLTLTMATINGLAHRVISAVKENDFSEERFRSLEERMLCGLSHNDRLVACGYIALQDFELWNAWHRVWMLGSTFGATGNVELVARFERSQDPSVFDLFEHSPYRGTQSSDIPEFMELFNRAAPEVMAVKAGNQTYHQAAQAIYRHLRESKLCPVHWKLTDPDTQCPTTFTLLPLARLAAWGYFQGPKRLQRNFDLRGRVSSVLFAMSKDVGLEVKRSASLIGGLVKDAWKS
jgi:tetracycline 7-halogenase / FADH2 O2-dependent halogenase